MGLFLYVGAEVAIGSLLTNYLSEPYIAGLVEADANRYLSFYWGGSMVGRFIGPLVMRRVSANRVLAFNAVAALVLVVATMATNGAVAMWTILAVGLFNSVMFPIVFTLAIEGLGKHTGQGSGILCMAIVGGAIVPLAQGSLADAIGIQHAFVVPALCYAYVAVRRPGKPRNARGGAIERIIVERLRHPRSRARPRVARHRRRARATTRSLGLGSFDARWLRVQRPKATRSNRVSASRFPPESLFDARLIPFFDALLDELFSGGGMIPRALERFEGCVAEAAEGLLQTQRM